MSVRIIAFGMVVILIVLFAVVKLLEKKLKRQSQLEASYAEVVFRYQEQPNPDTLNFCIQEVARLFGTSPEQAKRKLILDGVVPKN